MNDELRITDSVKRHFSHQEVSFDYHLVLEGRKTIAVSVLPSQTVVLKAPLKAADERIDCFLRRKFRWVLKQQRYFAQFKQSPEKRFVSGETFRYRGRNYKLLIRNDRSRERVSLQYGTLTVFTSQPKKPAHNRELIEAWYRERAHSVFVERLQACVAKFNYRETPGLMVKQMTRRWGSYSQKTYRVILNQELIKAATRHIDYVIIHELCHVKHRKHGRAFYDLLASEVPQWKKLKGELEISLLGGVE